MSPRINRPGLFALFIALQLMFVWRLADFIDELVNGPLKMSLGNYILVGFYALVAQALIIVVLLLLAYRTKKRHTSSEPVQ